jgi:hypothetical protein
MAKIGGAACRLLRPVLGRALFSRRHFDSYVAPDLAVRVTAARGGIR